MKNKPEDHEKITNMLIGQPLIDRPTVVDEQAGFTPPAWWKGDTYASKSGMAAGVTLRRRV